MNADDYAKALATGKPMAQENGKAKTRRFVDRKFMLTAYRQRIVRGRVYTKKMEEQIVSSNLKNKAILDLRRKGYGRVDCVEIETTVNEKINTMTVNKYTVKSTQTIAPRKMEFARQFFAAANNKAIPKAIEKVIPGETQTTIAWELLDNQEDAFLNDRPIVKVADRNAKVKAERKRSAMYNAMNSNPVDVMKIYHKETGMPMFSSTDGDAIANYIDENNLSLEDIVVYVPNEVYWELVGTEK